MNCPVCGKDTKVLGNTRYEAGDRMRRRRKCLYCNYRFATMEVDVDYLERLEKERNSINAMKVEKVKKLSLELERALNDKT